jgi:hypothetical protein
MSSVVISGNTSGTITLDAPAVAGTTTLTLPTTNGTIITTGSTFAGTGPAFLARVTTNQSLTAVTLTKVIFNNEIFDTNNNYDPSTNYRFTPTVTGYYQVNAFISWGGFATTQGNIFLYRNGSSYGQTFTPGSGYGYNNMISMVMYLNGSTDYVEVYAQNSSNETIFSGVYTGFSAVLVRSA